MRSVLTTELYKAFKNKYFYIALLVNCIIAVAAGIVAIVLSFKYAEMSSAADNPWLPVNTLYSYWIGDDMHSVAPYIFYVLMPLTACLAYGWSHTSEIKSGYVKNILTKTTRTNYYLAKYIATFASGAAVALLSLILNILLVACFIPAVKPDIYYNFVYIHYSGIMLSKLFFTHPILYLVSMVTLTSCFSGLYACISLSLSFFIKNKIAVTTLPFVFLIIINYLTGMFMEVFFSIGELSPLKFLHATTGNLIYLHNALIELALLFAVTVITVLLRGKKDDVF